MTDETRKKLTNRLDALERRAAQLDALERVQEAPSRVEIEALAGDISDARRDAFMERALEALIEQDEDEAGRKTAQAAAPARPAIDELDARANTVAEDSVRRMFAEDRARLGMPPLDAGKPVTDMPPAPGKPFSPATSARTIRADMAARIREAAKVILARLEDGGPVAAYADHRLRKDETTPWRHHFDLEIEGGVLSAWTRNEDVEVRLEPTDASVAPETNYLRTMSPKTGAIIDYSLETAPVDAGDGSALLVAGMTVLRLKRILEALAESDDEEIAGLLPRMVRMGNEGDDG